MQDRDDIDPQKATQVAALDAERVNAEAYGDAARVAAIDKQLEALGARRAAAAAERQAAAEESADGRRGAGEARSQAPRGRRARPGDKAGGDR